MRRSPLYNGGYMSIGAVSALTGVEVHTLRYWEKEFSEFLQPKRTGGKQRRYTADDVTLILEIKRLLKQEMYSIAGARRVLSQVYREKGSTAVAA
ncbi:MAG: MerR family transcriptional regulator [Armatimonadota bacterium]|nr:MerR family transcriptional regulator [Armatimonadota bacterium]